jgi:hypothetical protein
MDELEQTKILQSALNNINANIERVYNHFKQQAQEVNKLWAVKFVEFARKRLNLYLDENTKNSEVAALLAQDIFYEPLGDGYCVVVRNDNPSEPNLIMFLEYGTGLAGDKHQHPQASKIGWQYAVNKSKYVNYAIHGDGAYSNFGPGWFFKFEDGKLILNDDWEVLGKDGGIRAVFSNGIVPARFIYDTKRTMDTIYAMSFNRTKNGSVFNMGRFKKLLERFDRWLQSQMAT